VQLDRTHTGRANRLLTALPLDDLALLTPHLKQVTLDQGVVLHEQGDQIEDVYFPHDGIISLVAVMQRGDAIEAATVGREGAVGALAGLGPRRSHTRAVVQVAGSASWIAAWRFRESADQSAAIRDLIVRSGEMLLIQVQQTAACNALHDVEARLSRWLLQARDRVEGNVIRLTHEFLSQMLGVRRPTVTVVANALQRDGLIRYHRGRIEILDVPRLETRACECYAAIRDQIAQVLPSGPSGADQPRSGGAASSPASHASLLLQAWCALQAGQFIWEERSGSALKVSLSTSIPGRHRPAAGRSLDHHDAHGACSTLETHPRHRGGLAGPRLSAIGRRYGCAVKC
jgi:CRP-like cAMP-binding protein